MPYITKEQRRNLAFRDYRHPEDVGELNYCFTVWALQYIKDKGVSYRTLAEVRAALTDARDELYRRVVGIYENIKIDENGDLDEYNQLVEEIRKSWFQEK